MIWVVKCLKLTDYFCSFLGEKKERRCDWSLLRYERPAFEQYKCFADMHGRIIPDRDLKEDKTEDGTSEILWERDVVLMNMSAVKESSGVCCMFSEHIALQTRLASWLWANMACWGSVELITNLIQVVPGVSFVETVRTDPPAQSSPFALIRFNVFQPRLCSEKKNINSHLWLICLISVNEAFGLWSDF